MKKLIYILLLISTSVFSQNRRSALNFQNFSTGIIQDAQNTYFFNPESSGIVQGVVSDAVALNNVAIMNSHIQMAKSMSYDIFSVPVMDAFFDTLGSKNKFETHDGAIQIPSDFHFKMDQNTVLRRQPNNREGSAILSMNYEDNIKITGGRLIGEQTEHVYYQDYNVITPASSTTASISIQRQFVETIYEIPVTVSDASTNASEIATYLNAISDITASSNGIEIELWSEPGVYITMDDDQTDVSGIDFNGWDDITYGFGIQVFGAHNVTIEGVYCSQFHGDGIIAGITGLRNTDGTIPPRTFNEDFLDIKTNENLIIRNCVMDDNRRQGISIIDGFNYLIEYNTIINTGQSIWAPPAYGIDLECYREANAEFARIEQGIIRYNIFYGNYKGDIDVYNPTIVDIYGNTFEYKVANVAGDNIKVHDNVFTGQGANKETAIAISKFISTIDGSNLVHNVEIYNNNISGGYTYGIQVSSDTTAVYNNTIDGCTNAGIMPLDGLKNAEFYDNIVTASNTSSGYKTFIGTTNIENVTINNDSINIPNGYGFNLLRTIPTPSTLTITNTYINGGINDLRIRDSENITFGLGNTYTTVDQSGNTNVTIP